MHDGRLLQERYISTYVEQYMEKVFYFCLKKTGGWQEAEDLTSDISLCVFTQLRKGVIPERFYAWVWQIARNRYSVWADNKRRKSVSHSGADISDYEIADDRLIEEEYVRSEELSLLRRELAFISSDYREIVVAHYVDDKPVKEIATALQLTEGTVKMRLLRARNILKEGMSMAREFGIKSYKPEEVEFASSGNQPDNGLPWRAVNRKIPKNILLQASNNPSTVEELSIELGVAAPYMAEEVELLVRATLLKKLGDKYVTNFYIADKNCQMEMYLAQRQNASERCRLVDRIADDLIPTVRELGIAGNGMPDEEIKWWLFIHILDFCIEELAEYTIEWPEKRENGETWGFVGFEKTELPENLVMSHEGKGSDNAMFWAYRFGDYNMWNRMGELSYSQTLLLGDLIKNKRSLSTLTEPEKKLWRDMEGKFAHADEAGAVIPHMLVFEGDRMSEVDKAVREHALFGAVMENIRAAFDKTVDILKKNSINVLYNQFAYCASMQILRIRMMAVHDAVEGRRLPVPENPDSSTVAMYMEIR